MKKILILGANPETAALVQKAKEMGIYTIVTDYLPDSYAKKYADKAYNIDGLDVDGLVNLVKEEKIDGVMVGTADPLIPSYYAVCEKLGLPCYVTKEAVEVFTNKKLLKEVCKKFEISGVPEYTKEEVKENRNVQYPILIKPVDGRSGKGMSVCRNETEVPAAIDKALAASRCHDYMIERYMECDDVFMYYTFAEGKYYLSAMADRFTYKGQEGKAPVVSGAVYPSKHIELYMNTMHEKMNQLLQYLKIRNGVFLIQAFVENGKFYVYDPGFRLQGGAPHILMNEINHLDQRELLINLALNQTIDTEEIEKKNDFLFKGKIGASKVILLRKGVIKRIIGIDKVRSFPEIVAVTQRLFEGDEVNMIGTEQQILVRFHMVCETKKELDALLYKIEETVQVWDKDEKDMCIKVM